jgi:hypothetical protein
MKTRSLILILTLLAASAALAGDAYNPTDAERARWTMSDMLSWRTALEAYAKDNKAYPAAATIEDLRAAVEGKYMLVAPVRDAWGNPYRYERAGEGFRFVSGGADGRFDDTTWSTPGRAQSLSDDAVLGHENGWLFRSWSLQ